MGSRQCGGPPGKSECTHWRCSGNVKDDAHHVVFNCVPMDNIRWNHPSLYTSATAEVAAFVYECKKAYLGIFLCQNRTADIKLI